MEAIDLVTPVEKTIRLLSRANIDFYDATAVYSRHLSVNILGRGVREISSKVDVGLGVRAFKNRGLGVAYTQSLNDNDIEAAVRRAIEYSKVAQPDPYFKGIPGPSKAREVQGLFDEEVLDLTPEEAYRFSRDMIDACESIRGGGMYTGGFNTRYLQFHLAASTGVDVESRKTVVSAYIQPVYREGDDVGSSYEFDYSVSLAGIDPCWIGRRAAQKAIEQFGSRRVKSGVLPLILLPEPSISLFSSLLLALSGEQAVKGRTFASKLLGKRIAPEDLDIIDDGTIPGAVASSTYDGEGVPRRPIKVIEKGVVLTFLHNSYSAGIMDIESTGHAVRGGYGGYVGAEPTNIRVKPGETPLDEVIHETRRGILVVNASFSPNMVSGEFSTTIDEGFLIEDGERSHPVKNLMVGGNVLDILQKIELISKEGRVFGGGHFFPAVKVGEAKVSGE